MVHAFNKTIEDISIKFILHEAISCNDKDLPWINCKIKGLIGNKNNIYRNHQVE